MKILAISGSPRKKEWSSTYKLVKTIVENTGCDYDFISLAGKTIQGCIGCMQCADDNICKLKDDFAPLRNKIVEADAYIFGGCNFFSNLNACMHAFLERFYQFRHRENDVLWGKPAVTVSVGGVGTAAVSSVLDQFCMYNFIKVVDRVQGFGAAGCFYCGYGETCKVGAIYAVYGEGFKITDETTPCVTKDMACMDAAVNSGQNLAKLLREGHNREKAAKEVMEAMQASMKNKTEMDVR